VEFLSSSCRVDQTLAFGLHWSIGELELGCNRVCLVDLDTYLNMEFGSAMADSCVCIDDGKRSSDGTFELANGSAISTNTSRRACPHECVRTSCNGCAVQLDRHDSRALESGPPFKAGDNANVREAEAREGTKVAPSWLSSVSTEDMLREAKRTNSERQAAANLH
jgi:hypothetical protein